jgi:hypothetical protein
MGKADKKKKQENISEQVTPAPRKIKVSLKKVTVVLACFSQTYKKLTAEQFKKGETKKLGTIAFRGLIMEPGKPYELQMIYAQALIKDCVFQVIKNTVYGRPRK